MQHVEIQRPEPPAIHVGQAECEHSDRTHERFEDHASMHKSILPALKYQTYQRIVSQKK